jgi:hypothetical protein
MSQRTILGSAFAIPLAFLLLGCGKAEPPLPPMAPVQGSVTLDGKPLESGHITLFPQFDSKVGMSAGEIDDGEYVIYTAGKAGAPLGKYKVTVMPSMVPADTKKKAKTTKSGMPMTGYDQKFMDMKNTPLTVDVIESGGKYDLKLTK